MFALRQLYCHQCVIQCGIIVRLYTVNIYRPALFGRDSGKQYITAFCVYRKAYVGLTYLFDLCFGILFVHLSYCRCFRFLIVYGELRLSDIKVALFQHELYRYFLALFKLAEILYIMIVALKAYTLVRAVYIKRNLTLIVGRYEHIDLSALWRSYRICYACFARYIRKAYMLIFKRAFFAVFGIRLAVCGKYSEEFSVSSGHCVKQSVLIFEYVIL